MFKRKFWSASFIIFIVVLTTSALSSYGTQASEREEMYQKYMNIGAYVKGGTITPNWMLDGNSFWFAEGGPQNTVIHKVDPVANTKEPLFDTPRLRTAIAEALGHEPAGLGVPFQQFSFVGPQRIQFTLEGATFILDLDSYSLEKQTSLMSFSFSNLLVSELERITPKMFDRERFMGLGPMIQPEVMSPDGKWFVSVKDHNLVLRATVDGRTIPLTTDGEEMNAWDVETTLWSPWSPDGQKLVVARIDSKDVLRIPTIKWLKPFEEVTWVPTIACGGNLYETQLYIVDIFTKKPIPIEQDTSEYYYYRLLTWLPDGSEVLFTRYNRVMSRVDLQAADARTGKVRTLHTETSKTFVTHHHDSVWGSRTGFTLLPDASGYLYISERSGWRQLYHYDIKGNLILQFTKGDFPIEAVKSVDQENGWVYFTANPDQTRPYDTHLCRISLKGENFKQLTEGKGMHSVTMSPSNQYFVDTFSSVDVPPKTVLCKADGTLLQTLDEADISKLEQVGWVPPREIVVKADDGETDLWVTIYFPYDFDSNQKYPLVEYIYSGPQTMTRPKDFGAGEVPDWMAGLANFHRALPNLGFIVIVMDARGTPGRSKAFHDVVYNKFGEPAIADHAAAIKQLAQQFSFIDGDRVGIHGASWGGYHSFRAMVQAPDVYKVCISEFPGYDVHRFHLYEVYLGMPQDNKAAYDAADLFSKAAQLEGKLMMVGGINDTGTQADLFKMSEILIRLGKQHDMMVFPNTGHGAMGKSGQYHTEMKKNYFIEHLQPKGN